ncbi:hypothetical protein [Methylobacterium sp. WSM2598]|uniref:hypothetical protein n=1 Tax=Methylobacterium sp. WSM2598 TaxID=398261 RepID=UPI0012F702AB|nr:hypothetical protein [Methylobacterium sp. WSM2598]
MIRGPFLSATCLIFSIAAAHAAELTIAFADAGPAVTAASTRLGDHLDWGAAECGEPKYLRNVCVWELGTKFSFTASAMGEASRALMLVTQWRKPDLSDPSETKAFRLACDALVAALRPTWSASQVRQFTTRLRGKMRADRSVVDGGIRFSFYTWPETLTCEAQPDA